MKRRPLSTLLLLLTFVFSAPGFAEKLAVTGISITSAQGTVARLTAWEPVTYDLGASLVIIYFYIDEKGDRLLVTAVGPKDPDSRATATHHIVKMAPDGEYTINIDSDESGSEPMKLSAHYEGKYLLVAVNKM